MLTCDTQTLTFNDKQSNIRIINSNNLNLTLKYHSLKFGIHNSEYKNKNVNFRIQTKQINIPYCNINLVFK